MASATINDLSQQTASVVSRLASLRQRIAVWFWIDGMGRVLWLALALLSVDLVVDWLFRMDRPQRLVMLVLMLAVVAWLAWRRLVRPLSANMSDDALALQVESINKQLGQSLISALQLARMENVESRGMSPALVRQTVQTGTTAAEAVDFGSVLDAKELRLNSVILVAALSAFAALGWGIANNEPLAIWFNRNILLGERTWPQNTYLVIERAKDGRVVFPRGEDWTQVVTVRDDSKQVPETVFIDFRRARGRLPQAMKKSAERKFEAVFSNVLEPFEFRARGGDATTEWVRVELVEQPAVQDLKLVVTPPKYTGQSASELAPGKGPYYVLQGSSLTLSGKANKPLARAELIAEGQRHKLAVTDQVNFAGSIAAGRFIAGQYTIDLEDQLGLVSRRPTTFGIRTRPDREPRVRVRLIGVSGMVVPNARVPFMLRVTDDFGLTLAEVRYRFREGEIVEAEMSGKIPLSQADSQLTQPRAATEIAVEDALELGPLRIPTGTGFNFHFAALDNDDISGPNLGKSSDLLLRVVTEEELHKDLLRRQIEQRQEFERLAKNQDELLTDCRALQAGLRNAATLTPQQKDQLMQYQKRQKLIGQNTAAIAERLAGIVIEVQNNRLEEEGGKLQTRLTDEIIAPMQEVATAMVPEATQLLDRTRRQAAEAAPRDQALADAITGQQQISAKMQEILSRMAKSEGFQEAVNLLYEIQKAQSDVHDQTNKERQERIKRILDGNQNPRP